ncbi:MAG: class I SAM-dependent methyltransferase, partial [Bacteroidales bacterium]|nr:class I SAM-dependent methyltransferase [Bacteroidales bacterium]
FMAQKTKKQKFTGERLIPEVINEDTFLHLHRYAITFDYIKDKDVIDIACGEGYGSFLMSKYAKNIIGIDIDKNTIDNANSKYVNNNLSYLQGDVSKIPLQSSTIDVVVSFETIEHTTMHDEMMLEIKRVLKPDGLLIMSSPDKYNYSEKRGFRNKFHVKELYLEEFENLIKKYFKYDKMLFQRYFHGSMMFSKNDIKDILEYNGDFSEIITDDFFASMIFNVALASDKPIEINKSASVFNASKNVEKIFNSKTYKLANAIVKPFRFLKKIVH